MTINNKNNTINIESSSYSQLMRFKRKNKIDTKDNKIDTIRIAIQKWMDEQIEKVETKTKTEKVETVEKIETVETVQSNVQLDRFDGLNKEQIAVLAGIPANVATYIPRDELLIAARAVANAAKVASKAAKVDSGKVMKNKKDPHACLAIALGITDAHIKHLHKNGELPDNVFDNINDEYHVVDMDDLFPFGRSFVYRKGRGKSSPKVFEFPKAQSLTDLRNNFQILVKASVLEAGFLINGGKKVSIAHGACNKHIATDFSPSSNMTPAMSALKLGFVSKGIKNNDGEQYVLFQRYTNAERQKMIAMYDGSTCAKVLGLVTK